MLGTVNSLLGDVSRADYDGYGNTDDSVYGNLGYCGEYVDAETGFVYLRARYYDPSLGRFISDDPHWTPENMIYGDNPVDYAEINKQQKLLLGELLSNPGYNTLVPDITAIRQSTNLYVYCMNNPVAFVDLNGEKVYMIGAQVAAQLGIRLAMGEGIIFDEHGNVGKLTQFSLGAGLDVGASASGYFAVIDAEHIDDVSGGSVEIGASVAPIKIGPIGLGTGYDFTVGLGETKVQGSIYSIGASMSFLPADGHAQISYSIIKKPWYLAIIIAFVKLL